MLSDHLETIYTKGDRATQPGGIALRKLPSGELVCHVFNREPGSLVPTEYFWGSYGSEAKATFEERRRRAYDRGEAVMTVAAIAHEGAQGEGGMNLSLEDSVSIKDALLDVDAEYIMGSSLKGAFDAAYGTSTFDAIQARLEAETLANYPGYRLAKPEPEREYQHGDEIGIPHATKRYGDMCSFYTLGSVRGFYAANGVRDPEPAIKRELERGHPIYWANQNGTAITSDKRTKPVYPVHEFGDVIRFEGKRFRLDPAPNGNCSLVELEEPATAIALEEKHGHWASHDNFTVADWQTEVENEDTRLGYWEWVAVKLEDSARDDPDQWPGGDVSGHPRFEETQ